MDNSLETLLKQVLELEGLLLIAEKRGDDVPSLVIDMIKQKAAAIGEMAGVKVPDNKQGIDALPDDEPDDDITVEFVDDEETASADEPVAEEPAATVIAEPEPVAEPIPVVEPEPVAESAAPVVVEPEPVVAPTPEPTPEEVEPEAEAEEFEPDPDDQPLTLDEALQRDMTKDLRQAFSLNDRYRYRRELFGNSDSVMNETLNLIEAMHSFDEAEDYFYNDLQWEHDSPEVADFMVIIKNHFWNKRPQV
ncbi:MAG: hypothetical protein ACI30V_09270 [Muribaculaceae bacterium]